MEARQGIHPDTGYHSLETYRYDALGRRVWQRMAYGVSCPSVDRSGSCISTTTETLWDGADILSEIRAYADTGYIGSSSYSQTGTVTYLNGLTIDRPLEILKASAHDVIPLEDYHGTVTTGTCPGLSSCTDVIFPLGSLGAYSAGYGASTNSAWYGSEITGLHDGSGYVYQRNRYLNPETGSFTQEDPLGLGGGLNVYGFTGGDPVNYTDPFGLCPVTATDPIPCATTYAVAGRAIGAGVGVLSAGGCAVGTAGTCALAAPGIVAAGGGLGASIGGLIGTAVDNKDAIAAAAGSWWDKTKRGARKTLETIAIAVGLKTGNQLPKKPDDDHKPPPPAVTGAQVPSERDKNHQQP